MSGDDRPSDLAIRRNEQALETGTGLARIGRSVWSHKRLIADLVRRELSDLHAGQLGGAIWLVFHPLFLLAVYGFLFAIVLEVRIGDRGPEDYTLYLFSGLIPWFVTQDAFSRSTLSMISNAHIVKKVLLPHEILVSKTLFASVLVQSVLIWCLCGISIFVAGGVPMTFLLLVPLLAIHLMLLFGFALLLASIAPYFRDMPELVRLFCTVNVYLIPAIYLPQWLPEKVKFILVINPFSHLIWCYQDVFYFRSIDHQASWYVSAVFALVMLALGSATFIRLRHHMGSVL